MASSDGRIAGDIDEGGTAADDEQTTDHPGSGSEDQSEDDDDEEEEEEEEEEVDACIEGLDVDEADEEEDDDEDSAAELAQQLAAAARADMERRLADMKQRWAAAQHSGNDDSSSLEEESSSEEESGSDDDEEEEEEEEEVDASIDGSDEDGAEKAAQAKADMERQLAAAQVEMQQRLAEARADMQQQLAVAQADVEQQLAAVQADVEQQLAEMEQRLAAAQKEKANVEQCKLKEVEHLRGVILQQQKGAKQRLAEVEEQKDAKQQCIVDQAKELTELRAKLAVQDATTVESRERAENTRVQPDAEVHESVDGGNAWQYLGGGGGGGGGGLREQEQQGENEDSAPAKGGPTSTMGGNGGNTNDRDGADGKGAAVVASVQEKDVTPSDMLATTKLSTSEDVLATAEDVPATGDESIVDAETANANTDSKGTTVATTTEEKNAVAAQDAQKHPFDVGRNQHVEEQFPLPSFSSAVDICDQDGYDSSDDEKSMVCIPRHISDVTDVTDEDDDDDGLVMVGDGGDMDGAGGRRATATSEGPPPSAVKVTTSSPRNPTSHSPDSSPHSNDSKERPMAEYEGDEDCNHVVSWSVLSPELVGCVGKFLNVGAEATSLCVICGPKVAAVVRKTFLFENHDYLRYAVAMGPSNDVRLKLLAWMDANEGWERRCLVTEQSDDGCRVTPEVARRMRFKKTLGGYLAYEGDEESGISTVGPGGGSGIKAGSYLFEVVGTTSSGQIAGVDTSLEEVRAMIARAKVYDYNSEPEVTRISDIYNGTIALSFLRTDDIFTNPVAAVEYGMVEILKVYIEKGGIGVNEKVFGYSLLECASLDSPNKLSCMYLLSREGIDVCATCHHFHGLDDDITIMHKAVEFLDESEDDEEIFRAIVQHPSADVNMVDDYGRTLLHVLVRDSGGLGSLHLPRLKILLEAGADPTLEGENLYGEECNSPIYDLQTKMSDPSANDDLAVMNEMLVLMREKANLKSQRLELIRRIFRGFGDAWDTGSAVAVCMNALEHPRYQTVQCRSLIFICWYLAVFSIRRIVDTEAMESLESLYGIFDIDERVSKTLKSMSDDNDESMSVRALAVIIRAECLHDPLDRNRSCTTLEANYRRRGMMYADQASPDELPERFVVPSLVGLVGLLGRSTDVKCAFQYCIALSRAHLRFLEGPCMSVGVTLDFLGSHTTGSKGEEEALFPYGATVGGGSCDCCGKTPDEVGMSILYKCKKCRLSHYCSTTCQIKAWEDGHRDHCKQYGRFEEGDVLVLQGLQKASELNNKYGKVEGRASNGSRWAVRLVETPKRVLSIKAENVRHLRPLK